MVSHFRPGKMHVFFAVCDNRISTDRSIKTITNKPFGLSLSKASIGGHLAVRQGSPEFIEGRTPKGCENLCEAANGNGFAGTHY
jgi:hypothetical protein